MSKEIIEDIDQTIDQLIKNSELMKSNLFSEDEREALEKTQESLLARLFHRQSMLAEKERPMKLNSIKKKEIESAKWFTQKPARSRRARSKS